MPTTKNEIKVIYLTDPIHNFDKLVHYFILEIYPYPFEDILYSHAHEQIKNIAGEKEFKILSVEIIESIEIN